MSKFKDKEQQLLKCLKVKNENFDVSEHMPTAMKRTSLN
jgi:hypothetical protein